MLLDGCQGTSISTEIGDIEYEHELETEFHIEQMCKLCFRVNIQEMPESGQTLGEIYNVSRLLSYQARSSSDHMHSHREKSEELYVFRKLRQNLPPLIKPYISMHHVCSCHHPSIHRARKRLR